MVRRVLFHKLLFVMVVFPATSWAFEYLSYYGGNPRRWNPNNSPTVTFRVASNFGTASNCVYWPDVTIGDLSSGLRDLHCVANSWSMVPRSSARIVLLGGFSNTYNVFDTISTITTTTNRSICGYQAHACEFQHWDGPHIVGSDIVVPSPVTGTAFAFGPTPTHMRFFAPQDWTAHPTFPPGLLPFRQILLHEMGHSLGLAHNGDVVVGVMNESTSALDSYQYGGSSYDPQFTSQLCWDEPTCSQKQRKGGVGPLADDQAAIAGNDLVSGMYGVEGTGLPVVNDLAVYPEVRYPLSGVTYLDVPPQFENDRRRGVDTVRFWFSFANLGGAPIANVQLTYYLTPSEWNITSGTLVWTDNLGTVLRNRSTFIQTEKLIPSSIPPGRYYAAVVIGSTTPGYQESTLNWHNNRVIVNRHSIKVIP